MNNLIIVTGCPGTGKSHWARLLAGKFPGLQVLSYDEWKERDWDQYGFDNPEQKRQSLERSLCAFYRTLDERMAQGLDLLIEYPFNMRHAPILAGMIQAHGYRAVTLHLFGRMDVLYQRATARDLEGVRHPGHLLSRYHKGDRPDRTCAHPDEYASLEEFVAAAERKNYDISLGVSIPLDVTRFEDIDERAVISRIREATTL